MSHLAILLSPKRSFNAKAKQLSSAADDDIPAPKGTSPANAVLKPFTSTPSLRIS